MSWKQSRAKKVNLSPSGFWIVIASFTCAFALLFGRASALLLDGIEVAPQAVVDTSFASRADIVDRNGNLLATMLPVWWLYAHPHEIGNARSVARDLARILGDTDPEALARRLRGDKNFVYISKHVTPNQKREVMALGAPGLYFQYRHQRMYPAGAGLAHVLGSVRVESEGRDKDHVVYAGSGGVDGYMNERLRAGGDPLHLTIDLPSQVALRKILARGMVEQGAKGAAGVLLEISTGAVRALVSLPDYDPNHRADALGKPAEFNQAIQGVYELGSVLKPITFALAVESRTASMDSVYDISQPLTVDGHRIRDPYIYDPQVTLHEAVYRSSNIAIALAALKIGGRKQKQFLKDLGLLDPLPLELTEAASGKPLYPKKWRDSNTATIAFGHGISISPMHLAAAYATLTGDGRKVEPTLIEGHWEPGKQVVSAETVRQTRWALRSAIDHGTGRRAQVAGYIVAGKTGTADKQRASGRGYSRDRVISTMATVFPNENPTHVLVIMLDEPRGSNKNAERYRRTAGLTVAPIAAEAIRRLVTLLGVLPRWKPEPPDPLPLTPDLQVAGQ